MPAIDTGQLESLANLTFEDFKNLHLAGQNRANVYYLELKLEGESAGLLNIENYAILAQDVVNDSSINGQIANFFTNTYAEANAIDFSPSSDARLRLQYELMQADLSVRIADIASGGTGELTFQETIDIHSSALNTIGLTPEAFSLYAPLSILAEHDPNRAQFLFQTVIADDGFIDVLQDGLLLGFGASISSHQTLAEVLRDYGAQAEWLNVSLEAMQDFVDANSGTQDATIITGIIETHQLFLSLVGGTFDATANWLEYYTEGGFTTDVTNLTQFINDIQAQFAPIQVQRDPLTIDLDGDGNITITPADTVYFDTDNDGMAEAVSWVAANDGFLVRDANGNGRIDDIGEMFGDDTVDGFTALNAFDNVNDDVIDSNDTIWTDLMVWQDLNQDGISQSDELFTMSDLGFLSIDLNATGNDSTITTSTGSTLVRNINFTVDQVNTRYAGDVTLDLTTLYQPTLRGYSSLPDLHIAASLDNSGTGNLLEKTQNLAATGLSGILDDLTSARSSMSEILYRWSGVEAIAPNSRGTFLDDARKLEFLEEMLGEDFTQARFPEPDPLSLAAVQIMDLYDEVRDDLLTRFVAQMGGETIFDDAIRFDLETDAIVHDGAGADPLLSESGLNALGAEGALATDAGVFWANIAWFVDRVRGDLDNFTATELTWLDSAVALSDPLLTWNDVKNGFEFTEDQVLDGDSGQNILTGGVGNDTINGFEDIDTLTGNDGEDVIDGGAGNDLLFGNAGFDHLIGGPGDDTLRDGSGSDLIEGGPDNDLYIWEGGSNDFIFDESGALDVVQLGFSGTVQFQRLFTDDLLLKVGGNTLTLQNQLNDPTQAHIIEEVRDQSGVLIQDLTNFTGTIISIGGTQDDVITGITFGGSSNDEIYGEEGNDQLFGDDGDDILVGGEDDDSLFGGLGNDILYGDHLQDGSDPEPPGFTTSYYEPGLGNDTVRGWIYSDNIFYEGGHDVYHERGGLDEVTLSTDFSFSDVDIFRQYTGGTNPSSNGERTLTISLDENNSILISSFFATTVAGDIEWLRFADGSSSPIRLDVQPSIITHGSESREIINAVPSTYTSNQIYSRGGNDTIITGNRADFVDAGEGNDRITTSSGQDEIWGGEGDGNDTVNVSHDGTRLKNITFYGGTPTHISEDDGNDSIIYQNFTNPERFLVIDISDPNNGSAVLYNTHDNLPLEEVDTLISIENVTVQNSSGLVEVIITGNNQDNLFRTERSGSILASGGNDTLIGVGTNRIITLDGGSGDDFYNISTADVTVFDESGLDTVSLILSGSASDQARYDSLSFADDGNDLIISWELNVSNTGTIRITDFYLGDGIENLQIDENLTLALAGHQSWNFGVEGTIQTDGTNGPDVIFGHAQSITINGLDENDIIYTRFQDTTVNGGLGNDHIYIRSRDALVNAGEGNDEVFIRYQDNGGVTQQGFHGGSGNDSITFYEFASFKLLELDLEAGTVDIGVDTPSTSYAVTNFENATGANRQDLIKGTSGNNTLKGEGGSDILVGRAGNDLLDGGNGDDAADYSDAASAVNVNLIRGETSDDGDGGKDTLISIEDITGSAFDDMLRGDDEANVLVGGPGDDELFAEANNGDYDNDNFVSGLDFLLWQRTVGSTGNLPSDGDKSGTVDGTDLEIWEDNYGSNLNVRNSGDELIGDAGQDVLHAAKNGTLLTGGADADEFVFGNLPDTGHAHTITDFNVGEGDSLNLVDLLFEEYDPGSDLLIDFIEITDDGTDTRLSVDPAGSGNYTEVANLSGATDLIDIPIAGETELQTLVGNGVVIVDVA